MRDKKGQEAQGSSSRRAGSLGFCEVSAKVKLSQNISAVEKSREHCRIKIIGNFYPNNAVKQ